MGKVFALAEKFAILAMAFVAVLFFMLLFKIWSNEKINYFFFVGDWETVIAVIAFTFILGKAMEWLWKWEVRALFKRNGPLKRRRN